MEDGAYGGEHCLVLAGNGVFESALKLNLVPP